MVVFLCRRDLIRGVASSWPPLTGQHHRGFEGAAGEHARRIGEGGGGGRGMEASKGGIGSGGGGAAVAAMWRRHARSHGGAGGGGGGGGGGDGGGGAIGFGLAWWDGGWRVGAALASSAASMVAAAARIALLVCVLESSAWSPFKQLIPKDHKVACSILGVTCGAGSVACLAHRASRLASCDRIMNRWPFTTMKDSAATLMSVACCLNRSAAAGSSSAAGGAFSSLPIGSGTARSEAAPEASTSLMGNDAQGDIMSSLVDDVSGSDSELEGDEDELPAAERKQSAPRLWNSGAVHPEGVDKILDPKNIHAAMQYACPCGNACLCERNIGSQFELYEFRKALHEKAARLGQGDPNLNPTSSM